MALIRTSIDTAVAFAAQQPALVKGSADVIIVTGSGGSFGFNRAPEITTPASGLRGLAKALAVEFSDRSVGAVDLDPSAEPVAIARSIFSEIGDRLGPLEIGITGDRRIKLEPEALYRLVCDSTIVQDAGSVDDPVEPSSSLSEFSRQRRRVHARC